MDSSKKILTIPNILTFTRIPVGIAGILLYGIGLELVGILVLAVGGFTDFLDGYIARKTNSVSEFGAKIDPIVDKVYMFIVCSFVFLISDNSVARITVTAVVIAEFLNAGLYLKSSVIDKGVKYKVSKTGKYSMALKMTAIWILAIASLFTSSVSNTLVFISFVMGIAGVLLSFYSFVGYLKIQSK